MKAFSKVGLLAAVALLATAAVATGAQAVTWNPDNTRVLGVGNFTLTYGTGFVSCDPATAEGHTGLDSPVIPDWTPTSWHNCAVEGVGPAEVDCMGDMSLIAQQDTASGGTGTVALNDGFACTVTTATCTVTVSGPQPTQDGNLILDEASQILSVEAEVQAERTGSILCGPAQGSANFAADWEVTTPDLDPPVDITIDP
jgi:hypothetical protein